MENENHLKELIIADVDLTYKTILEYVRRLEEGTAEPASMILFVGLDDSRFPLKEIDHIADFVKEKDYSLRQLIFEYQGGLVHTYNVSEDKLTGETTISFYLQETAGKKPEKLAEQLQKVNMNRFIVLSRIVKEPLNYVVISRSMIDALGKSPQKPGR